jgi:hypothetical protein
MISEKDRTAQFTAELRALLAKYGTAIELEDVGTGYSPNYTMVCHLDSVYDGDVQIAEFTTVNLGSYVAP